MKTGHFTLLTCSLIVDNNSTRQQEGNKYNLDFFLKIGACVFWAPYFFQVFWWEISPHFNGFYLQKNWCMSTKKPVLFKSFGGKIFNS